MVLAWPLMAVCLFIAPKLAPWYVVYVVFFNMLVGPVFAAGAVTNERERETLELLLTTTLSPWQILWGKLLSSLRISVVLTGFLVLPLLLAWILPPWTYVADSPTIAGYVLIIALTSLTTTVLAVFCSVLFRTSTTSLMTAYLLVILLFLAPLAIEFFAVTFFPDAPATAWIGRFTFTSPMAAAFALPLSLSESNPVIAGNVALFRDFLLLYGLANLAVLWAMIWLFKQRWRVT
jgi:ABC-type transport system involved in multi-copper enzyme maturation permease subunit